MPVQRLKAYLDENDVKYVTIGHSQAFTAAEIAETAHIPGKELAKTVMVKLDGEMVMVVLPATERINLEWLREATGAELVELASEEEFSGLFPNCEVGAMPPFGNLWNLQTLVDQQLREDERIAFNAGTLTELVQLSYADFERLVEPTVLQFGIPA